VTKVATSNKEGLSGFIDGRLTRRHFEQLSGVKFAACFQCEKCSNGCPLTFAMDILPHRLMHGLQLSMIDEAINSDTIWVCASCETCTSRCPNEIDIAHVMNTLRQLAGRGRVKESQRQAAIFHSVFLSNIRRFGRLHEASMAVEFALKSGGVKGLRRQTGLGLEMMRRGKLKLIPGRLRAGKEIKGIFRKAGERPEQ
jgi:heterodisulfide reductase subunit C